MSEPDITCKELVELLNEYLEGGLSPHDRARLDAHLAGCEGCSNALAQLRTTIEATGRLTEDHVSPEQRIELVSVFRRWRAGEGAASG